MSPLTLSFLIKVPVRWVVSSSRCVVDRLAVSSTLRCQRTASRKVYSLVLLSLVVAQGISSVSSATTFRMTREGKPLLEIFRPSRSSACLTSREEYVLGRGNVCMGQTLGRFALFVLFLSFVLAQANVRIRSHSSTWPSQPDEESMTV